MKVSSWMNFLACFQSFAKPLCCRGSAGLCDSASHSCNVGPHLSFSKTVITDSHVDFSALMSPQCSDQVLKIIFPNRDMSKHVPSCRKKPTPNSSWQLSFPSLNSRVSGTPVHLTLSSIPGGLCHQPQDVCPAAKGVSLLCAHKTVPEQVLAPGWMWPCKAALLFTATSYHLERACCFIWSCK